MIKSIVIIFSVFLILKGYKLYKFLKLNVKKIPKVSFEEQLKWFQDFGFQLNDGISKEDLLAFYGTASEYENQPWELLYITFGYTAEREPWIPLTNDCWHFDTECIEGSGSSIEILENLKRISKNELNFKNIKDFIDFENGKAWVSFEFNDETFKWDLKVDNDWVDSLIFYNVQRLITKLKTEKKLTFYGLGQDCIFGYMTEREMEILKSKTALEIKWLDSVNDIG